ncbi:MAG: hypothetical protein Q9175_006032 [Cornicularia normoerica]
MAISLALLVGIIVGAVGLTSLTVILIVLGLRHKDKRLLSQINAPGERRLSGFHTDPSPIMSITDEDVARMPGTRASVHRSLHTPYNRNSLYTPMASRESLPRRAYIPKVRTNDRDDHEPTTPQQSWPLPRRMTRADGTPLVKIPSSTVTPVTERSKKSLPSPPPKDTRNAAGIPLEDVITSNGNLGVNGKDGDVTKASSATDLTPKPLFHGQYNSSSQGMIAELADGSKTEPRASRRISQFARSKSMYTQEPGLAPPQPLPPLPFEITSKRLPRVKSPEQSSRRASGGSLFSEQTCILDDNWSKAFSQAGTHSTPTTLASAPIPTSTSKGLGQYELNHVVWDSTHQEGRASPMGAAKQVFQPQLNTQRSFCASIQESLPRSKSSGLSLSMSLHGPSRAESRASPAKDPSSTNSKSRVAIPRSPENRRLRRGISPSSPLRRATDFTIHDDTKSKRASTSVLHAVSGNEGSPISESRNERPHSIATSNPLEWDMESLPAAKPSTPKDRRSGHQRQTCTRTSNIFLVVPSPPKPTDIEEREELPQENPQPHNNTRPKQTTFRPPSRQAFNFAPQTALGLHRDNPRITDNNNSPFSPTQFMMNLYREDDTVPESEVDTPTRKPSSRRSSSTHPNRRKTMTDHPIPPVWPLPTPATENDPDPEKPNNNATTSRQSTQSADQDTNPESRPTSLLLDFPWPQPPRISAGPNWREPKTPIRRIGGPRPPPFRYISPNGRRSPTRSGVGKRSASPAKDLRRSVAALRRMNSEVVSSGARKSREHKRYLSIGESESSGIFEEDISSRPESRIFFSQAQNAGGEDERLRVNGKENLMGPRDMRVFGGVTKLGPPGNGTHRFEKSPNGSMYDGDGFLIELEAWLR